MRRLPRWHRWLAASTALLLWTSAFQAGAAALEADGSIQIQFPNLPPAPVPGTPSVLVNGSSGSGHLASMGIAAGQFSTAGLVIWSSYLPAEVSGIQVTASNAAGSFGGGTGTGPLTGKMALSGVAKICLFGPCSMATGNIAVPLDGVGSGGAAFVDAQVKVTTIGAPWTSGTVPVGFGTSTAMGALHGPASLTSSTARPSGAVTLVSPVFVSTSLIGAFPVVPTVAFLTLHFVPEPGTMLLLGSGIAGLAVLGYSRTR